MAGRLGKGNTEEMLVLQTDIREHCPNCGLKVIQCGSIIDSVGWSHDEQATYIGDVVGPSNSCSGCGAELIYQSEKKWDDGCFVCDCSYWDPIVSTGEWQKQRNCYRWWCPFCEFNVIAMLLAERSRLVARALWIPLLPLSLIFWICAISWMEVRDWRHRAIDTRISN